MILFVDDESREIDSFVRELQSSGHDIVFHHTVDAALAFFDSNRAAIRLLILDIMMPPGSAFEKDDTQMGLRTGIRFYERIREAAPDLPVILFTNVSEPQVIEKFKREPSCLFLQKSDHLPFELADRVNELLNSVDKREDI